MSAFRHHLARRVVVTGATGFLGRATVAQLASAGHEVTAVDLAAPATGMLPDGVRFTAADLRNEEAPLAFLKDAEVLLHLANLNDADKGTPQRVLAENTAINANVLQAAADVGVPRCVFASSVQAMSGGPWMPACAYPPPARGGRPALPFEGTEPPHAGNAYGLSKVTAELFLAMLAEQTGLEAIALRFPHLVENPRAHAASMSPANPFSAAEAYGWLWLDDAARLLVACTEAGPLPGYRAYHPSAPPPPDWPDAETLARHHLPHTARRDPGARLSLLVDTSRITRDTGWAPSAWDSLPAPA